MVDHVFQTENFGGFELYNTDQILSKIGCGPDCEHALSLSETTDEAVRNFFLEHVNESYEFDAEIWNIYKVRLLHNDSDLRKKWDQWAKRTKALDKLLDLSPGYVAALKSKFGIDVERRASPCLEILNSVREASNKDEVAFQASSVRTSKTGRWNHASDPITEESRDLANFDDTIMVVAEPKTNALPVIDDMISNIVNIALSYFSDAEKRALGIPVTGSSAENQALSVGFYESKDLVSVLKEQGRVG